MGPAFSEYEKPATCEYDGSHKCKDNEAFGRLWAAVVWGVIVAGHLSEAPLKRPKAIAFGPVSNQAALSKCAGYHVMLLDEPFMISIPRSQSERLK